MVLNRDRSTGTRRQICNGRCWPGSTGLDAAEIERLIEARAEARRGKDFGEADRIRDQLAAEGVIIEDLPDRTRWRLGG